MTHLGDRLSALVDGELSHDERDRVLAHLTRCAACRELVESERAVKARLVGLAPPPLPPTLVARLRDLPAPSSLPGAPMATPGLTTASRGGAVVSAPTLPARRLRRGSRRPGPGRARGSGWQRRRVASAGALVGVALATAFVVGGEQGGGATVRPPVDRFSIEHASVTGTVPLVDPASLIGAGGRP